MQLGFYFDQTRCTGCEACVVACKDWNNIPAGPAALCRIISQEKGRFPDPSLSFYPRMCFHCAEPACVDACPTSAIRKRPRDGVVVVDGDLCISGCRRCLDVCPYYAPQFVDGGPMRLCNLCRERREAGSKPACVLACSQHALDAGSLEELRRRYGGETAVEGFSDPGETRPSILFRVKTLK